MAARPLLASEPLRLAGARTRRLYAIIIRGSAPGQARMGSESIRVAARQGERE